jgi:hypothetical protein
MMRVTLMILAAEVSSLSRRLQTAVEGPVGNRPSKFKIIYI